MSGLLTLAAFVQAVGAATFPDDSVAWRLVAEPAPVYDAASSVLVYTAEPSSDVGCASPRFVVNTAPSIVLAVYCDTGAGYAILAR